MESFFHDSDQQVSGDSDPHLSFDCVLGSPKENFDTKMLFDPFEEQLNLPALTIQVSHRVRRDYEVVGQNAKGFVGLPIVVFGPA